MKTLLISVIIFFTGVLQIFAQDTTCVFSGSLRDTSGLAIIGAQINFTSNNKRQKPLLITITDEKGNFNVTLPKAQYRMVILYLGQNIHDTSVDLKKDRVLLPITLPNWRPVTKLKEVTINGQRPQVSLKNGTLVFQPNIITAQNAWSLLKITPMVLIKDEKVSILGKGQPIISINGRMLNLSGIALEDYIKSIPAKNIKYIQVTPNTLADADANSKNGRINIVLKKIDKGYQGLAYLAYLGYRQATHPSFFGGASFTLSSKKVQWNSSVDYDFSQTKQLATNDIFYPSYRLNERNIKHLNLSNPSLSTSLDYQPNKRNIEVNI